MHERKGEIIVHTAANRLFIAASYQDKKTIKSGSNYWAGLQHVQWWPMRALTIFLVNWVLITTGMPDTLFNNWKYLDFLCFGHFVNEHITVGKETIYSQSDLQRRDRLHFNCHAMLVSYPVASNMFRISPLVWRRQVAGVRFNISLGRRHLHQTDACFIAYRIQCH